jgi:anti-sigma factor RsiW
MSRHRDVPGCERVLGDLERYVDGDMAQLEQEAVARHLDSCEGCRTELDLALAVRDELRALPMFDAPTRVIEATRAATSPTVPDGGMWRWWRLRPSPAWAVAAALVLAAVLAPLVLSPPREEPVVVETLEIEQATEQVRLALAYVGQYSRRAGVEIRDGLIVERLVVPAAEGLSSLREAPGVGTQGERNET